MSDVYAFPASFAQQRLWFLDQIEPGTAVYNIPQAFRLRGPLRPEVLDRAAKEVVRRHEALRTTFGSEDGKPLQIVHEQLDFRVEVEDLTGLPQPERFARAEARVDEEARRAFVLDKGPLLRINVFVLDADDHVLFLNVHHIVCDGWSLALFFSELSTLYAAFLADEPSPLPEREIQYADYALWQHEFFSGEELERELSFWKDTLAGDLPLLALPFDRNRPPKASLRGKLIRFNLDAAQTEALRALAQTEKASLFMILLAAFQTYLGRISNETDILVGTPIANRDREEIRDAIGFYTNTVVFRNDLAGAPSFAELVKRVRDNSLSVLAHQEVPLERVVEAVNPNRRSGDNPIFQVMFANQVAPESALALPQISASPVLAHTGTSKFDLLLEMQELPQGMQCFLEYSTDLFDDATAERMASQFQHLLHNLVAAPQVAITDAPLLTDAERVTLLESWNDTAADYRTDARLHDLFATQAAEHGDKLAVVADGREITYHDLDRRSNQLAHHLQSLGAAPDVMIGVFVERSVDMMVALLGVLKSGAAYLPLDPSFPADRVAYMLQDAGAPVIIAQAELEDDLPDSDATIVCIDSDWETIARSSEAPPACPAEPGDLAYSIYTSGSTGKPKGVEIPHRAAVNFLTTMAVQPGISADDTLLAVTTLSFDISVLELFLPLSNGATVAIATDDETSDGQDLMDLMDDCGVTMMQATPATWSLLIEAGWEKTDTLRRVLCGGEAWPPGIARELLARVDELWNMYGPTETTIWSTCARITDPDDVNIGRPIANTQVYVLDRHLAPVPVGVAGELFIGGDGVARGYHERAQLTAERFVRNPFGEGRLYRTGDLVKYGEDGSLRYLNRLDNQVKVRGYRIELGEIESVLEQHESIKQPVVIVWDSGDGDRRVAAYIVHHEGKSATSSELRKFLRLQLPDYMIPHLFVTLERFPLTANGKVDRKALPDPIRQGAGLEREYVAPETPTEVFLADLWSEILGVDKVGVHDNFFDLGGHSLLSTQVTFKIAKRTGYRLSPRALVFQNLQQIAAELPATA